MKKIIAVDLKRKIIGKIQVPDDIPQITMIGVFSKRLFNYNKANNRYEEYVPQKAKVEK